MAPSPIQRPPPNHPTHMKSQLISLLMFAAPLMLQALTSDHSSSTESATPANTEPVAKEVAAPAAPAPAAKPASASCAPVQPSPAPTPATPATPATARTDTKPGHRISPKLAPWLM